MAAKAAIPARAAFEAHYMARANLKQLRKIYDAARATVEARRTRAFMKVLADIPLDTSCNRDSILIYNKPTTTNWGLQIRSRS